MPADEPVRSQARLAERADPERPLGERVLAARARRLGMGKLRELREETSDLTLRLAILAFALFLLFALPSELGGLVRGVLAAGAALAALLAIGLLRANEAARIVVGVTCALLSIAAALTALERGATFSERAWRSLSLLIWTPGAFTLLGPGAKRRFAEARAARRSRPEASRRASGSATTARQ